MENASHTHRNIRYISPTTDFGFKKLFGDKKMMMSFLNALFDSKGLQLKIEDLEYIDKEESGTEIISRGVVYDLKCQTSTGEKILVEMQNESQDYFENRIIYYMARAVSNQGFKKGSSKKDDEDEEMNEDWNFDIHRVIGVFLMNFNDTKDGDGVSRNCWTDISTGEISSDKQEYWKVRLPHYRRHKFKKSDCKTKIDYWLYNLSNMGTMKEMAFTSQDSDFVYLSELADFNSMTIAEQDRYIHDIDQNLVYQNTLERRYRFGFNDGEKKGLKKGRALGRAEGAQQTMLTVARNMIKHGDDINYIISITGLTSDEIEAIKC